MVENFEIHVKIGSNKGENTLKQYLYVWHVVLFIVFIVFLLLEPVGIYYVNSRYDT